MEYVLYGMVAGSSLVGAVVSRIKIKQYKSEKKREYYANVSTSLYKNPEYARIRNGGLNPELWTEPIKEVEILNYSENIYL